MLDTDQSSRWDGIEGSSSGFAMGIHGVLNVVKPLAPSNLTDEEVWTGFQTRCRRVVLLVSHSLRDKSGPMQGLTFTATQPERFIHARSTSISDLGAAILYIEKRIPGCATRTDR